jgi:hypothetical protein
MIHYGVVEDRLDPKKMGRVRVRIAGLHSENLQDIPTEALPWATVMTPTTSPSASGVGQTPYLATGSWVVVIFNDAHMQDPLVIGTIPGYPSEKRSTNVGFSDPAGQYPRWTNESDLPRYARQNKWTSTRAYQDKSSNRLEDIQTAHPPRVTTVAEDSGDEYYQDNPWSEVPPANDHVPQYPMNHVMESESGHVMEFDDTPGNRRRHIYHPSGTYEEIYDDGTRSIKIVGKDYEMVMNGRNVYIKGDLNITTNGDVKQLVYGNYHLEVEGDYTQNVKGSVQQKIRGNYEYEINNNRSGTIAVNDSLTIHGNQNTTIMGDRNVNVDGFWENTITGNFDITTFSGMTIFSNTIMSQTTLGPLNVTASGNITVETPSNMTENFGGNQTTTAVGNIDINATRIDLN